jgi:hypothetical protein
VKHVLRALASFAAFWVFASVFTAFANWQWYGLAEWDKHNRGFAFIISCMIAAVAYAISRAFDDDH